MRRCKWKQVTGANVVLLSLWSSQDVNLTHGLISSLSLHIPRLISHENVSLPPLFKLLRWFTWSHHIFNFVIKVVNLLVCYQLVVNIVNVIIEVFVSDQFASLESWSSINESSTAHWIARIVGSVWDGLSSNACSRNVIDIVKWASWLSWVPTLNHGRGSHLSSGAKVTSSAQVRAHLHADVRLSWVVALTQRLLNSRQISAIQRIPWVWLSIWILVSHTSCIEGSWSVSSIKGLATLTKCCSHSKLITCKIWVHDSHIIFLLIKRGQTPSHLSQVIRIMVQQIILSTKYLLVVSILVSGQDKVLIRTLAQEPLVLSLSIWRNHILK